MTIVEAGVLAGIPAGATIGGIIAKSYSALGIISGLIAGSFLGALGGWVYSLMILLLVSLISVLWRSAQSRKDKIPSDSDMELMSPIAVGGTILGLLALVVGWSNWGWIYAIGLAVAIGFLASLLAVARCELHGKPTEQ